MKTTWQWTQIVGVACSAFSKERAAIKADALCPLPALAVDAGPSRRAVQSSATRSSARQSTSRATAASAMKNGAGTSKRAGAGVKSAAMAHQDVKGKGRATQEDNETSGISQSSAQRREATLALHLKPASTAPGAVASSAAAAPSSSRRTTHRKVTDRDAMPAPPARAATSRAERKAADVTADMTSLAKGVLPRTPSNDHELPLASTAARQSRARTMSVVPAGAGQVHSSKQPIRLKTLIRSSPPRYVISSDEDDGAQDETRYSSAEGKYSSDEGFILRPRATGSNGKLKRRKPNVGEFEWDEVSRACIPKRERERERSRSRSVAFSMLAATKKEYSREDGDEDEEEDDRSNVQASTSNILGGLHQLRRDEPAYDDSGGAGAGLAVERRGAHGTPGRRVDPEGLNHRDGECDTGAFPDGEVFDAPDVSFADGTHDNDFGNYDGDGDDGSDLEQPPAPSFREAPAESSHDTSAAADTSAMVEDSPGRPLQPANTTFTSDDGFERSIRRIPGSPPAPVHEKEIRGSSVKEEGEDIDMSSFAASSNGDETEPLAEEDAEYAAARPSKVLLSEMQRSHMALSPEPEDAPLDQPPGSTRSKIEAAAVPADETGRQSDARSSPLPPSSPPPLSKAAYGFAVPIETETSSDVEDEVPFVPSSVQTRRVVVSPVPPALATSNTAPLARLSQPAIRRSPSPAAAAVSPNFTTACLQSREATPAFTDSSIPITSSPHRPLKSTRSVTPAASSYQTGAADEMHLLGSPAFGSPAQQDRPMPTLNLPSALTSSPRPDTLAKAETGATTPSAARRRSPSPLAHLSPAQLFSAQRPELPRFTPTKLRSPSPAIVLSAAADENRLVSIPRENRHGSVTDGAPTSPAPLARETRSLSAALSRQASPQPGKTASPGQRARATRSPSPFPTKSHDASASKRSVADLGAASEAPRSPTAPIPTLQSLTARLASLSPRPASRRLDDPVGQSLPPHTQPQTPLAAAARASKSLSPAKVSTTASPGAFMPSSIHRLLEAQARGETHHGLRRASRSPSVPPSPFQPVGSVHESTTPRQPLPDSAATGTPARTRMRDSATPILHRLRQYRASLSVEPLPLDTAARRMMSAIASPVKEEEEEGCRVGKGAASEAEAGSPDTAQLGPPAIIADTILLADIMRELRAKGTGVDGVASAAQPRRSTEAEQAAEAAAMQVAAVQSHLHRPKEDAPHDTDTDSEDEALQVERSLSRSRSLSKSPAVRSRSPMARPAVPASPAPRRPLLPLEDPQLSPNVTVRRARSTSRSTASARSVRSRTQGTPRKAPSTVRKLSFAEMGALDSSPLSVAASISRHSFEALDSSSGDDEESDDELVRPSPTKQMAATAAAMKREDGERYRRSESVLSSSSSSSSSAGRETKARPVTVTKSSSPSRWTAGRDVLQRALQAIPTSTPAKLLGALILSPQKAGRAIQPSTPARRRRRSSSSSHASSLQGVPSPSIMAPTKHVENSEAEQPHSNLSEAGSYARSDAAQEEADSLAVDASIATAASEGNDESLFVERGSLVGDSGEGEVAWIISSASAVS